MREMGDAVQFDFEGDGDLLLDFFGGVSGPLGDDLGVGVGDVGIGLDGQSMEGKDAPDEEHERRAQNHEAVAQGEVDQRTDHSFFSATSVENSRALVTSSSPGFTPSRICCMPSGARPSAWTGNLAEAVVAFFAEDPVFVVQAHDGGGWDHDAVGQLAGAEGGDRVHAGTESAIGVAEHDAHFCAARVGIEHAGDVGDLAFEDAIGKGIQADFGGVAEVNFAQIVFEDIADHPDFGEIGDGEQVGSVVEALDAFESGDVLFDDGSRYGSFQIDQRTGMRGIGAQDLNVMLGGFDVDFGFVFGVLRGFEVLGRDGAAVEEHLSAVESFVREHFIGLGLLVIGHRGGEVGAGNHQQRLTFRHGVAELYFEIDDAATAERSDVDGAVHVG